MESLLTSEQMRKCDQFAIRTLKIPGLVLMENAGRGAVDSIQKHIGPITYKSFLVVCGKGNNGGDGFVIARHLVSRGARVVVGLLDNPREYKGDSKINFLSLQSMERIIADDRLSIKKLSSSSHLKSLPETDVIMDAMFGTGFQGDVRGFYKTVIEWINKQPVKRIAIDIPSGLNADTGEVGGTAVKADFTITMAAKKVGLFLGQGPDYAGAIDVVDITIPAEVIRKHNTDETVLVEKSDVRSALPRRIRTAHKHSVGKIFVLAGAVGYTGAAAMTASSAMRAGAGAVILGTPRSVHPILAKKLTEVMVDPLDDTFEGAIGTKSVERVLRHIAWADVVVIGPGLSRNPETQEVILEVIQTIDKPLLIDADGLNALAEDMNSLLKCRSKSVILTPHVGEFSRLAGRSSREIESNRVESTRTFAKQYKVNLVLKGAPTVTATPSGKVYVNSTGNPGMATAGSGDVLSGLIAGLWGQGMSDYEAAYCGVYLHGLAGDRAAEKFGKRSLLAMDIHDQIAGVLMDADGHTRIE